MTPTLPRGQPMPPLRAPSAVARGSERSVYEWAGEPGLLIKLMHPGAMRRDLLGRPRDPVFARERRAWRLAQRYAARTRRPSPVVEIVGYAAIAQGAIQVVRKVADAEGRIGPTLETLVAAGAFTDDRLALLNALVADVLAAGIVVYDARAANIVLETAHDRPARFVLVDGFGDRSFVPLRAWVPALARARSVRALHRTARETGLHWDASARRFSFPQPPTNGASSPQTSRTRASRRHASR